MDPAVQPSVGVAFGRFRVLPHRRELLADGQPVKLGGRTFDLLLALIEARGAVVSKDALMARVWPGQIVEVNNLQTHISALRAAFGAERSLIRTVSGRGYQFTGDIRVLPTNPEKRPGAGVAATKPGTVLPATNLHEPVSELIGRDDQLREIADLAAMRRLVTLAGPGGIGKTRLALAVAHRLLPQFADGAWLAELAPLSDADLVPSAVAAAVGLEPPAGIAFGRFRVLPHRRELLADGQPVKLGDRSFDVLMALIEAAGAVLSKDALIARVWPAQIVEENSLQTQISALRAALGTERGLIRTVAGRGYQFTGEIRALSTSPEERCREGTAATEPGAVPPPTNLPEPVSELIGRDQELHEIVALVATRRLVTLTGAGGIGKTRLALAVAHQLLPQFADGVWLVELSPLADHGLVPTAVATAVGLEVTTGEVSAQRVAYALANRRMLLVLDTCEHMIAAATAIVEATLRGTSFVRIIATSREPLRAEGERIYPLSPLAVPTPEDEDPWRHSAVQLFMARSCESGARVPNDRHTAAVVAGICRRLDGLPLAIELAATRVPTLDIGELAARLDDRFQLLTGGRRTALPRHQTLRATLDWSYELLGEPERVVLRRLAVFAGHFSLNAACAVVASPDISSALAVEVLLGLAAKSLVSVDTGRTTARYRLLDTTRGYALMKLVESSERQAVERRHAEYYRHLFEHAEVECETLPTDEWLADCRRWIDDLRAALDWAFSPDGDDSIGVALAAAAVPLWLHLTLLDECRARAAQALSRLEKGASWDPRQEMKLRLALGASLMHTKGAADAEIGAACTRAHEIAESLDDADYQLRSLWGLWYFHTFNDRPRQAMALAQRSAALAADHRDLNDRLIAERMTGVSKHHLGDQVGARHHLERVIADYVTSDRRSHIIHFQVDVRMAARVVLARILWLQGFPDQAVRVAETNVADALATGHANSLCYVLAVGACPIALFVGDLASMEHHLGMLFAHATRHGLGQWRAFGTCFQGTVSIRRGDVVTGLRLMRAGFDNLGNAKPMIRFVIFLMAEALGHAGQVADGLTAITEAIEQSVHTQQFWLMAELLRIKGELLLMQEAQGAMAAAGDHFRKALDWARHQGVLSLELRAATSFARLLSNQGCSDDATALLRPVYNRFTEGFDTADLKAAKELLGRRQ